MQALLDCQRMQRLHIIIEYEAEHFQGTLLRCQQDSARRDTNLSELRRYADRVGEAGSANVPSNWDQNNTRLDTPPTSQWSRGLPRAHNIDRHSSRTNTALGDRHLRCMV